MLTSCGQPSQRGGEAGRDAPPLDYLTEIAVKGEVGKEDGQGAGVWLGGVETTNGSAPKPFVLNDFRQFFF